MIIRSTCDALAATIEAHFNYRRIRTATSLSEALQQLRIASRDLYHAGLNLPDGSGLSGFLKIKGEDARYSVIVISAFTSKDVVQSVIARRCGGVHPQGHRPSLISRKRCRYLERAKPMCRPAMRCRRARRPRTSLWRRISRKIAHLSQQQTRILSLICEGMPNKLIAYEMQLADGDRQGAYHGASAPAGRPQSHPGGDAGTRSIDPPQPGS